MYLSNCFLMNSILDSSDNFHVKHFQSKPDNEFVLKTRLEKSLENSILVVKSYGKELWISIVINSFGMMYSRDFLAGISLETVNGGILRIVGENVFEMLCVMPLYLLPKPMLMMFSQSGSLADIPIISSVFPFEFSNLVSLRDALLVMLNIFWET